MTQDVLTSFFGWMALLNIAFLTLGTVMLLAFRDRAAGIHARLFGIGKDVVLRTMYSWLAAYKVATFALSIIPYLALRII